MPAEVTPSDEIKFLSVSGRCRQNAIAPTEKYISSGQNISRKARKAQVQRTMQTMDNSSHVSDSYLVIQRKERLPSK